jgi:hypothetical protein
VKRSVRNKHAKWSWDHERARDDTGGGEILENCIEKNFHVSNI